MGHPRRFRLLLPAFALLAAACHPRLYKQQPVTGLIVNTSKAGHAATEAPLSGGAPKRESCVHQVSLFYPFVAWGDATLDSSRERGGGPVAVVDHDYLNVMTVYRRTCQVVVPGGAAVPASKPPGPAGPSPSGAPPPVPPPGPPYPPEYVPPPPPPSY